MGLRENIRGRNIIHKSPWQQMNTRFTVCTNWKEYTLSPVGNAGANRELETRIKKRLLPALRQLHKGSHTDSGGAFHEVRFAIFDPRRTGNIQVDPGKVIDEAEIWNSDEMQRMRRLHVAKRANEIDICSRCCTTIPYPSQVAGSLILHGRTVRKFLPWAERLVYLSKLPRALLTPPKKDLRGERDWCRSIANEGIS